MIIHRIRAKNVLKYTTLELNDLPERGLIAITGLNESGKSTIGETLCFGLFGRTFSLDYDDLEKVICWGETHCSVEIEFTASDGKRYSLDRFLDDAGNHSARLTSADAGQGDEPLARGVEKVADRVYELIGYEYEEFIESFYLAQREITTPHPHSYAIKTMAGLVTLEYCSASFMEESQETEAEMGETGREIGNLEDQIMELELDPAELERLQTEQKQMAARLGEANRQLSELDEASVEYQDALPKRDKAMQARATAGFFRLISLLFALVLGGGWVFLNKLPEHQYAVKLNEMLSSLVPDWNPAMLVWLLYAAGGFVLLFVIFWVRRAAMNRRLKELEAAGQKLSATLDGIETEPLLQAIGSQEVSSDEAVPEYEEEGEDEAIEAAPSVESVDLAARQRLSQRASEMQAELAEVREGVGRDHNLLRSIIDKLQDRQARLDGEVAQEQAKIDRAENLDSMRSDLVEKNTERQVYVERCELAGELLQGAMREVSFRFNQKIRDLVSKTLPLFTEGRYEHLQVSEDLSVRAFSTEKRDFMDLEEISSGTQRQIMLAVRLALSQELVGRAVKSNQFLFLDEPFAFFDQARTRSALKVLPSLSEQLNQIWIIGQEFPDDVEFDLHVKCSRETKTIP